ncbi:uncharacterized protein LOC123308348 [Coccinella septempunctata]|uniref:uncharacterized protein LOC123308348 n=1 Tax=Coccinella septempunctata TaxID=41139 RepID=UPI001D0768E6|nr:uncharacterized protein LOC123308348 [Coccinella septempunctata]
MVKLFVVVTALHIASVSTCPLSALIPSIDNTGHGGVIIRWYGFFGMASLGKFITRDPTDGVIIVKIRIPTGGRALVVFDADVTLRGIYGHLLIGAESSLGAGMSMGIGSSVRLTKWKWGMFAVSSTGMTKVRDYHFGNYAGNLMQLYDGFLKMMDTDNMVETTRTETETFSVQSGVRGRF